MYIPRQFQETRIEVLSSLIAEHPLATFIVVREGRAEVNHLPMVFDLDNGERGVLRGHVARANPVWEYLDPGADSIAVFQGPSTYVSPSWYPSKIAHQKVVPTWNYAVVHAQGKARHLTDPEWLLEHVTDLTAINEHGRDNLWKVTDAPSDFVDAMIDKIVGIELPVESIAGKWKISQNRSHEDRRGVVAGLRAQADENSTAVADLISERD